MRALVSRGLLVSPLVCAALVLGPAAASAAAAEGGREATGPRVAQTAPRSGTGLASLLDRGRATDPKRQDRTLAPLLDTLPDLTTGQGTRIDPARAATYAKAVRAWSNRLQERLQHLDAGSADRARRAAPRTADPVPDLPNDIGSATDSLLSSLTSLDLGGVLSAVTGLLDPVLEVVTEVVGGVPALPSADPLAATTTVAP